MTEDVEKIEYNSQLLAIIVYASFRKAGISFFTPGELSQQLAYMRHPPGKKIEAHLHNPVPRTVQFTHEALFVKSGKLRVDFYSEDKTYLESRILGGGDVIMLVSGGHGFDILEETEMLEVKQGPYAEDRDKTRFPGISADQVVIKGSGQ